MNIGIALFTYKRTETLKAVLAALKKNKGIDALYIFQDGMQRPDAKWHEVNQIINQVDWCRTIINVAEGNRGLADSVVSGINLVLDENDAVIVLEDDCIPHIDFYQFMKQCLEKYEHDKQVFTVSGYAWPIEVEQPINEDVYFCGRISSWGWGTWKDRWAKYSADYSLIKRIRASQFLSEKLALWGNDLESFLIGNITGALDSWLVFWALTIIWEEGYCLNPYQSLIKHIGYDDEARHCINDDSYRYKVELSSNRFISINFPLRIEISSEIENAVVQAGLFDALKDSGIKEKVLVYGLGNFYAYHKRYLLDRYRIEAYIDRRKEGFYHGKKIIKIDEINQYEYEKIIVMLLDTNRCREVFEALIKQGVEEEKIVIFNEILDGGY